MGLNVDTLFASAVDGLRHTWNGIVETFWTLASLVATFFQQSSVPALAGVRSSATKQDQALAGGNEQLDQPEACLVLELPNCMWPFHAEFGYWDLNHAKSAKEFQSFVNHHGKIVDGVIEKTIVVCRDGPFKVKIFDDIVSIDVKEAEQVKYLLSYVWDGIQPTPIGDVARSTPQAAKEALVLVDHVWVDFLAHANGKLKSHMIEAMGMWYCREDIYVVVDGISEHSSASAVARFERSTKRGWIFQETTYTRICTVGINLERAVALEHIRHGIDCHVCLEPLSVMAGHLSDELISETAFRIFGVRRTRSETFERWELGYTGQLPPDETFREWCHFTLCEFVAPVIQPQKSLASLLVASRREFYMEADRFVALTSVIAASFGMKAAHNAEECSLLVAELFCTTLRNLKGVKIMGQRVGGPGFCNVLGLKVNGAYTIPPNHREEGAGKGEEGSYDILVQDAMVKAMLVDADGNRLHWELGQQELLAEVEANLHKSGWNFDDPASSASDRALLPGGSKTALEQPQYV